MEKTYLFPVTPSERDLILKNRQKELDELQQLGCGVIDSLFLPGTLKFIETNMQKWIKKKYVTTGDFNELYKKYMAYYYPREIPLSCIRINRAIEIYCAEKNIKFIKNHMINILGRCRFFYESPQKRE